jgi:hypothetical protein
MAALTSFVVVFAATLASAASDGSVDVGLQRADAAAQAIASASGTVARCDGSSVDVKLYEPHPQLLHIALDAQTLLFQGDTPLLPGNLRPGMDVRVHYRRGRGLVGYAATVVDVLDPTQARLAERAADAIAPRMSQLPSPTNEPRAVLIPPGAVASRPPHQLAASELKEKEALLSHATGSMAGEVLRRENGYVVLAPLRGGAPRTFRLPVDTPVYDTGEQLTAAALVPGAKVRAWFKSHAEKTLSQIVAVEVLTSDDLRLFERTSAVRSGASPR